MIIQFLGLDLSPLGSIQLGSAGEDRGFVSVAGGRVFVGGTTEGSFVKESHGSLDAFSLRVHEPATVSGWSWH